MSASRVQLPGLRTDSTRPLQFSFNGRAYTGHAGDTLASALLANDVRGIARSLKYGRARGIVGAGAEEPNALVQVGSGALATPNLKATQVELYAGLVAHSASAQAALAGRLKTLLGHGARFMPAGFQGKTFKWPRRLWPLYEAALRGFSGFGAAPSAADPERYDHLHHHVDLLVVGAGACGLLAALQAARAGLKTLLLDEQNEPGGWLLSDPAARIAGRAGAAASAALLAEFANLPQASLLTRCTAIGLYEQNLVQAVELLQDHLAPAERQPQLPRQRLHKIRARQVVLATGAIERPLVFGNNDLPGVMTASAAQTYLQRYGVLAGRQVVLCGGNDLVHDCAQALAQAGADVTLADLRADARARSSAYRVLAGHAIAQVLGNGRVRGVRLLPVHAERDEAAPGAGQRLDCDLVLSSAGLAPSVHLLCHDGSRPQWDAAAAAFVAPAAGRSALACVGAVTGAFDLQAALAQTTQAMQQLLAGFGKTARLHTPECAPPAQPRLAARHMLRLPDGKSEGAGAKAFVDYQNDVSAADIALAVRENQHSIEHVKRYTALGFGTDQGKLSNVNGAILVARALGRSVAEVGTTSFRPPYTPVSLGALAGTMVQECFDPCRQSALHAAHLARGAALEPVGQWLRPWYFAQAGEDMQAAVRRECLAARNGVALMDASTLGKIQIDGPDAREFLNRVYSNGWKQLAPGCCRYGLMLDENGMVFDDGVTACISDHQFHMTTTTGGAARVFQWLERWHQSEWPDLRVWLSSVTDHWATIALVGPKSRAVLAKLCSDIDLSGAAFKFMDWRAGHVHGLPVRVFRVSFSGELAYEINVESGYGQWLWEALLAAGQEQAITPYGTETMHVLRAEKGFIIAGQDSDGAVNPLDLGMSWAIGKNKAYSFLGHRSLARSDSARAGRKQLVGLLSADPTLVLAEGAQLTESIGAGAGADAQQALLGHVTSSYHSAFLGRSIALALVAGGAQRMGQTLYAHARGSAAAAQVVGTVFVDPEGAHQNV